MSSVANWSYTARATIWPFIRLDDRWGKAVYGPPVSFDCDYGSKRKRRHERPVMGDALVINMYVWTEYADAKVGDRLVIGEFTDAEPVEASNTVAYVDRDADTFERLADDYEIGTAT